MREVPKGMSLLDAIPGVSQARMAAYLACGLAALSVVGYATYIYVDRLAVRKELNLTSDLLTACRKNGEAMAGKITEQNTAIDNIKADADKRAADSKKAVAEARKLTTTSQSRVNEIMASAPLNTDLCESARLRLVPQ